MDNPSGSVSAGGTITSYVSPGVDTADYWDLTWAGAGRLKGVIGAIAPRNIRLRLYDRGSLLDSQVGTSPTIAVDSYDFGAACTGPIVSIEPMAGSTGQCIQYFVSGVGLTEPTSCDNNPDGNDTYADIQDKPWMWLKPMDAVDSICGVVCREGANSDRDTLGISGQPFTTQGGSTAMSRSTPIPPTGIRSSLTAWTARCSSSRTISTPPFYLASVELDNTIFRPFHPTAGTIMSRSAPTRPAPTASRRTAANPVSASTPTSTSTTGTIYRANRGRSISPMPASEFSGARSTAHCRISTMAVLTWPTGSC